MRERVFTRTEPPKHATPDALPNMHSLIGGASGGTPKLAGERVLEIGAGSGRDAARLLALGVEVDAVEPSAALRERALADHPELEGRLFHGFLPVDYPLISGRATTGSCSQRSSCTSPSLKLFDAAFQLRERLEGGAGSSYRCRSNEVMSPPAMSATSWAGL